MRGIFALTREACRAVACVGATPTLRSVSINTRKSTAALSLLCIGCTWTSTDFSQTTQRLLPALAGLSIPWKIPRLFVFFVFVPRRSGPISCGLFISHCLLQLGDPAVPPSPESACRASGPPCTPRKLVFVSCG
jgi:hypothetical protein